MKSLVLFLSLLSIQSFASHKVCLSGTELSKNIETIFNEALIPEIPALVTPDKLPGKNPQWNIKPLSVQYEKVDTSYKFIIFLPWVEFSTVMGSPPFNPRIGARAVLRLESGMILKSNGKLALHTPKVYANVRVTLGGTIGYLVSQFLNSFINLFGVQGTITKEIEKSVLQADLPALEIKSTLSVKGKNEKLGTKIDSFKLQEEGICIESSFVKK